MAEAVREEDIDPLEPSATPVVIPSEADIRAIGNASEAAAMASHLASLAQNFSLPPSQRAMLLTLAAIAEQRKTEINVEEAAASLVATPLAVLTPFEKAVFSFMSDAEKRYFESIDPNAQYETTMVDANGKRVTLSGDQLRKDLITITENSLPPEQQKELEKLKTPESPQERLERTQEALERLKSRKDREVEEALEKGKITSEEAEKRLEKNDEAFKKAQENIGKAKKAHKDKERFDATPSPFQNMMQKDAEENIKATEENVRESLRNVREVMAEDPAAKPVAQKPEIGIQIARGKGEGHGLAVRAPARSTALQFS